MKPGQIRPLYLGHVWQSHYIQNNKKMFGGQYFVNIVGPPSMRLLSDLPKICPLRSDEFAKTGIVLAENYPTIIIGEDTDVLVLLLFHSSTNTTLHYKSDQSNRRANTLKVWDISKTKKLS